MENIDFFEFFEKFGNCPCGSNKPAAHCCRQPNGRYFKSPRFVSPPPPVTGFANEKCYLRASNDCSTKITKEHYVSNSILKFIADDDFLILTGNKWIQEGTSRRFNNTKSLTANILCDRHNNCLSPLDIEAFNFIKILDKYNSDFINQRDLKPESFLACGEDFELWFLKTLCGIVESNQLSIGEDSKPINFDPMWAEILQGEVKWPDRWGLYVTREATNFYPAVSFRLAIDRETGNPEYVVAHFFNLKFKLAISDRFVPEENDVYHPTGIGFSEADVTKGIDISWRESIDIDDKTFLARRLMFHSRSDGPNFPDNLPNYPIS